MATTNELPCDTGQPRCDMCPLAYPERYGLSDAAVVHLRELVGKYGLDPQYTKEGFPVKMIDMVRDTVDENSLAEGDIYQREHLLADAKLIFQRCRDGYTTRKGAE